MRVPIHAAAIAIASLMLAIPAASQSDEKGFRPKATCPPYCPMPGQEAPSLGGPEVPDAGNPIPDHPRKPRWRPRSYYYNYGWPYGLHPRYYDDPYFATPHGYGYYDDYDDDSYEFVLRSRVRVTCSAARNMLRRSGYRNVKAIDCKGRSFGFIAQRNGKRYQLIVSSRSGTIISRKRL